MISNVTNITTSSLQNASKTLEVSAANVANSGTKGQIGGTQENSKAYVPRRVENTSQAQGGVRTDVKELENGTIPVFDPQNPAANAEGLVEAPNVDLAEEIATQKQAGYQFDASAKVLKEADEVLGKLIDIIA